MVAEPACPPQVTVVVLSYNRPDLLEKALRSGVRLVANTTNRGFTGGMNQGLAEARGEYVYLTEDDIELARDCVATLVEYLSQHPEAALAGPVMWNLRTPRSAAPAASSSFAGRIECASRPRANTSFQTQHPFTRCTWRARWLPPGRLCFAA